MEIIIQIKTELAVLIFKNTGEIISPFRVPLRKQMKHWEYYWRNKGVN